MPSIRAICWRAMGTTAVVRAPTRHLLAAQAAAAAVVREIEVLASRFRPDSELSRINDAAGRMVTVSPRMADLVRLSVWAAEISDGAVDPTLGRDLERLGYDRDFAELSPVGAGEPLLEDADGPRRDRDRPWRRIEISDCGGAVRIPHGVRLDLGAIAKGHAADLAAAGARDVTGAPVLVSLGGDIATAGDPPSGEWLVGLADDHAAAAGECSQTVRVTSGALATSGLLARRWWRDGRPVHHVLDPRTGAPVAPRWRTVTVTAATCAEANVASTASLVLGDRAPAWLREFGLPARLVAQDGSIVRTGDWPA